MQERMTKLEKSQQTAVIHTVHSEGVASLQDEISLLSNTPHPIQEQEIESTNTEESPLVGTPPQGEAVIHTVHSEGVASLQDEISLLSNTPHPIQEQEIESTNTEESPLVGTPPQGEASMNYEDFFGKLLVIAMETETLIFYFV